MLYCANCQIAVPEGEACPMCGGKNLRAIRDDDPVLLLTAGEDEAVRIAAAFEEASIPCMTRSTDAGGYSSIVLGRSRCSDVRIFAPFGDSEHAREVLLGIGALKESGEPRENTEPADSGAAVAKKKNPVGEIIAAVLFFSLVWLVVSAADSIAAFVKGLFS